MVLDKFNSIGIDRHKEFLFTKTVIVGNTPAIFNRDHFVMS